MRRVAVVGSVNIDLMLRCAHLPRPGETVAGDSFTVVPGGKGANQAVAAARLGAAVDFIGCVGDDDFGAQAAAALVAEGIGTAHLRRVPGRATGVAMVLVEASGQNCIALDAGANAALSPADVDAAAAQIAAAGLLLCQLESPLPSVLRAVETAHAAGVPVLLNPAPAQALPAALLRRVDWLVPNEGEAAQLCGLPPGSAPAEAAERLRAAGAGVVLVTLGAQGVLAHGPLGRTAWPAPVVHAVDTTGAGDTFVGALAVALLEGLALADAVAFAQRAAAFSVQRVGAQASMPHRAELAAATGAAA